MGALHNDIGCSYAPNSLGRALPLVQLHRLGDVERADGGLLAGTTCVIFDGNPGGSKEHPDWGVLWRFAAETGVTFFGAGAAFYANCMKAGITPAQCGDLSRIRALGTTGSPLSPEVQQWGTAQTSWRTAGPHNPTSGGTTSRVAPISAAPSSAATASCRRCPARCSAACWAPPSRPGTSRASRCWTRVGELVCTQPIPSMPLYLWGDKDGNARTSRATFDMYPPATAASPAVATARPAWARSGAMATGSRSARRQRRLRHLRPLGRHHQPPRPAHGHQRDLQRRRILPEVLDSLVVDLEYLGRESYMPLFVVLRPGQALDEACARASTAPSAPRSARASCPTTSLPWPKCRAP
jgi:acetoacetyl-CoA synthetase